MNGQEVLKETLTRVAHLAKAIETAAGALSETLGDKTDSLSETFEKQSEAVARAIGSKAGPVAKAVEEKADVLGDALEDKFEQARKDALESIKGVRFGQREAILVGIAVGALIVIAISRRIDREAAAARLRAAASRVGESAHDFGARVGESAHGLGAKVDETARELGTKVGAATAELTSKAGELAGQVKDEVSTRADSLTEQLRSAVSPHDAPNGAEAREETEPERHSKTTDGDLDEARQRLSAEEPTKRKKSASEDVAASDEATDKTPDKAPAPTAPEAVAEPRVSDGMKVVAFDGTDIGRVQEMREDAFVLNRPKGADLLVPLDQVARVEGTVVYLRVDVNQVTKMGWEKA